MKDEERKVVKEELKKKIDEMSDEELDKVAGGTSEGSENEALQILLDLLDPDKKKSIAESLKKALEEKQNG